MTNKFTPKQQRFIEEYLVDLNGTQAAIRAGYSEKTACEQAVRLLANVRIQQAIQEAMHKRSERTGITADMVLRELAKIGFSNMRNYAAWGPSYVHLMNSSEISEDDCAAVQEVTQTVTESGVNIKFKLHDKKGSLELIGKHLGMFVEKKLFGNDPDNPLPPAVTFYLPDNGRDAGSN